LLNLTSRSDRVNDAEPGLQATGLALLVLALATIWVEPAWGIALLAAAALACGIPLFRSSSGIARQDAGR
jgi:hypothetical protein